MADINNEELDAGALKVQVDDLNKKVSEFENTKKGMEAQIIEQRERARKADEARKAAEAALDAKTAPPADGSVDVEKKVYEVLSKEKSKDKEKNKEEALKRFQATHKEYHPENDTTGVQKDTLEKALAKLNTQDSYTVEEIMGDLEAAHTLATIRPSSKSVLDSFASDRPSHSAMHSDKRLTEEQDKIRQDKGWTVEKYLEMKSKYPALVP